MKFWEITWLTLLVCRSTSGCGNEYWHCQHRHGFWSQYGEYWGLCLGPCRPSFGDGGRKYPASGNGVCLTICMKWEWGQGILLWNPLCLWLQSPFFLVPRDFSNLVLILGTWHKASKMHHTFTCKTQSHAGDPPQKPHFLKFNGKPLSSSDFLVWHGVRERREGFDLTFNKRM